MADSREILEENIREFIKQGKDSKKEKAYNSAVTLYFKALAVLADLYIYNKTKVIPSNHTQRFRILEEDYPEIYNILDTDFPVYQDSYKLKLSKEHAEVLEKHVKRLASLAEIKVDI